MDRGEGGLDGLATKYRGVFYATQQCHFELRYFVGLAFLANWSLDKGRGPLAVYDAARGGEMPSFFIRLRRVFG
jgi:hypothetical protein